MKRIKERMREAKSKARQTIEEIKAALACLFAGIFCLAFAIVYVCKVISRRR